ncbi:MAG: type II secretion system F family protein [Candidatus Omnitrophota bacterium]
MVIAFTRQLYILVKAGIPLLKALQIIQVQLPEGKFRLALDNITRDIQEGKSFSEALCNSSHFFSLFYINMIKAAEVSGNMTAALKELSVHLTQMNRLKKQVQTAFLYPIFVLATAATIVIVLLVFVLPVFIKIFEDMGGKLPPATQFLIWLSNFTIHWGWLVLVVSFLLAVAIFIFSRRPYGKYIINVFIWKIPLFGQIFKIMDIGRFCRVTGTLLSSGVTLMQSLDVLREVTTTVLLNKALEDIQFKLAQGINLSVAMEEAGVFPLTLVRMIQVGEESGKIAELFLDAAEDYETEVSSAITGLLSLLEPALIVVMGAVVGFIVISLFFPILTMSSMVK